MRGITVFDTSICTQNVGDEIIMESVNRELITLFKKSMFLRVPTHEKITKISYMRMKRNTVGFVGGTNLLAANMRYPINQWNIHLHNTKYMKDTILMGVGSQNYDEKINWYTRLLYNKALSKDYIHSVRDSHTEKLMRKIGFNNVINTGCPTMWKLDKSHCEKISKCKSENVICTLTDYNKDFEKDSTLIKILLENYNKVYCWIQGSNDYDYIKSISSEVILVNPHLECYDEILDLNTSLDYIGTRLHAGIRAIQKGKRSIILVVDNRAREMGKDYNLNIIERENIDELEKYIYQPIETKININQENIDIWRNQFRVGSEKYE